MALGRPLCQKTLLNSGEKATLPRGKAGQVKIFFLILSVLDFMGLFFPTANNCDSTVSPSFVLRA